MKIKIPDLTLLDKKTNFILLNKENIDNKEPISGYAVGMGLFDNIAYASFKIAWVNLQLKIMSGNNIYIRCAYGNNGWSDWKQL